MSDMKIAIIGAGAAGYFAAIHCAEHLKKEKINADVLLIESGKVGLRKVKISGGGRCNVTHHEYNIPVFCENYPRGKKELRSPFHVFQAEDTVRWFEERGVKLKVENDGRMFPVTNKSETIIECLVKEAKGHNVKVLTSKRVQNIEKDNQNYLLSFSDESSLVVNTIVMATGSDPKAYKLIENLGHEITSLAPSLFTFKIDDVLLKNLAGTTFKTATVYTKFEKKKFESTGPILVTHWGLSGPAVLKMSSMAAREMSECNYKCKVVVNFTPYDKEALLRNFFLKHLSEGGHSLLKNHVPFFLTKNFWLNLLEMNTLKSDKKCNELSLKAQEKLIINLFRFEFSLNGQSRFKEEFVQCGGVKTKEVDFKTMESKINQNLYFAGEVLDIDGVTGGFNFQNAWTTGFLAGKNLAEKMISTSLN